MGALYDSGECKVHDHTITGGRRLDDREMVCSLLVYERDGLFMCQFLAWCEVSEVLKGKGFGVSSGYGLGMGDCT